MTYKYKDGPVLRFFDTATAMQELPKQKAIKIPITKKMGHGVIFIGTKVQPRR